MLNNLIFNSCRESADHGPINSWDRQPFVTLWGLHPGKASALMAPRHIVEARALLAISALFADASVQSPSISITQISG